MYTWRKWKTRKNREEFNAERKVHAVGPSAVRSEKLFAAVKETADSEGGQSYSIIAADIGCHNSTIFRTINQILVSSPIAKPTA